MIENICEICGSNNKVHVSKKFQKTLCQRHYSQLDKMGRISEITKYDPNQIEIFSDRAEIILRNSFGIEVARSLIDISNVKKVSDRKWMYEKSWGYVVSPKNDEHDYVMLQNFIMDSKELIDHKNRNRLDNRENNLRISNRSLNAHNSPIRSNNTSEVTGVSFVKWCNLWRAYIAWNSKRIELGYRKNKEDAIYLRLSKEKELMGDDAPQKHLFQEYGV